MTHSPTLGWTVRPYSRTAWCRTNSRGIRSDQEYAFTPPAHMVRMAAFGDSFTFAPGVTNHEMWEAQLQQLSPSLEVLNFGVEGYGLDQAFLRYRQDGVPFDPHIVLIGFLTENISRHVNVFRPFYHADSLPFAKPRFRVVDGRLALLDNPLPSLESYRRLLADEQSVLRELGKHDYFFKRRTHSGVFDFLHSVRLFKIGLDAFLLDKPTTRIIVNGRYNTASEAYGVTIRLFEAFHRAALDHSSLPLIVIFPTSNDLQRYRKDRSKVYAPLLDDFRARDFHYIEILEGLEHYGRRARIEDLYLTGARYPNHLSPLGNWIAAKHVLDYLETHSLTTAGALARHEQR